MFVFKIYSNRATLHQLPPLKKKGLSYEIDFKNVDKNLQILA